MTICINIFKDIPVVFCQLYSEDLLVAHFKIDMVSKRICENYSMELSRTAHHNIKVDSFIFLHA